MFEWMNRKSIHVLPVLIAHTFVILSDTLSLCSHYIDISCTVAQQARSFKKNAILCVPAEIIPAYSNHLLCEKFRVWFFFIRDWLDTFTVFLFVVNFHCSPVYGIPYLKCVLLVLAAPSWSRLFMDICRKTKSPCVLLICSCRKSRVGTSL